MDTNAWGAVGIIGCGSIFPAYVRACRTYGISIGAIADASVAQAQARGQEYDLPVATIDDLLNDERIAAVVILTPPSTHAQVALDVIAAGKHVYVEKPLAANRDDAAKVIRAAEDAGVRIGCAPDSWMAAPCQTAMQLIADDGIGEIVGVSAAMMIGGHESWHPNPQYYYQPGAGPLFDMGPYYLTQLIALCGPIESCHAYAHTPARARHTADGTPIPVDTPTHIVGSLRFASGVLGSISMSFDVAHHTQPHLEIYGTRGSLRLPDPNTYAGRVFASTDARPYWHAVQQVPESITNMRGMGLVHLLKSTEYAAASRVMGRQVVEVMESMLGDIPGTRRAPADALLRVERPAEVVAIQASQPRSRALIIAGGWDGHAPMETSHAILPYLHQAGVDAEIVTDVAALLDGEFLRGFDVIVPNMTMGELPRDTELALCAAVSDGIGLAGWHGGCGDAFRSATDYQHMVGGQFVAHPGGLNTTYTVNILDDQHDITRSITDFGITTEQYYMHIDPAIRVLASTRFGDVEMPVAWTKMHGSGRVFYQSIGHDVAALTHPSVLALTVNGIAWAARTQRDSPVKAAEAATVGAAGVRT